MVESFLVEHGRVVRGTAVVPGSKSITNRALVCAALAAGESRITGALDSDDTRAMIDGLRRLGAVIAVRDGALEVGGVGGRVVGGGALDVRASGTTMRFLAAVASLSPDPTVLDGTQRMQERPIAPLVEALTSMGVDISTPDGASAPLTVIGPPTAGVSSVRIDPSASSQYVSALMLIGPLLSAGLRIEFTGRATSRPYLSTTAEVMGAFGADVDVRSDVVVVASGAYSATAFDVEPDASAAVYPWVGAAITGGEVTVAGLSGASTQADMAVLEALEQMGAIVDRREASIVVRGPARGLVGIEVDLSDAPDGALALAVAASTAHGPSRLWGLGTLRGKETDRLAALSAELSKVGCVVRTDEESISITPPDSLEAATIATYDDHRIAMSFALLGLVREGIRIEDPGCVVKTWPRFWDDLETWTARSQLPVIAIDGPAGTGKTTVATRVAEALGASRLDTGAFYRTATLLAQRNGIDPTDGPTIADAVSRATFTFDGGLVLLDGLDVSGPIREPSVNEDVSVVSAHPEVRSQLVAQQRAWVGGGDDLVIVEGRDIGTVVFPDAALKVYLDARPEVRAARRAAEVGTAVADELERLAARDVIDTTREASPLRPADDAWILDTSNLSIEEVVAAIVERWERSAEAALTRTWTPT